MNSWLDRGLFMGVYFGTLYLFNQGKQPTWETLFIGVGVMFFVGLVIEGTKANWLK